MAGDDELKKKILSEVKEKEVAFIQMRFVDIFGVAKCCEMPVNRLEEALESGFWFDGSSIEGFTRIFESDMFLKPDLMTFATLPWTNHKVAKFTCDVYTDEKTPFEGDPRFILKRALAKAKEMGYEYKVGPELEFFLFKTQDGVAKPEVHDAAAYFDLDPLDLATELRREIIPMLDAVGLTVEMGHHEVAPGQHEIDFKYGEALNIADQVITYKNTVKTLASKYGLYASFMPKPIFGINGSGMHVHQSLWKDGKNAFFDPDDKYSISKTAKSFIAGQLEHVRKMSAVLAPTVNSYKRLVPGYEAPVYICWGQTNRSALIRVPRIIKGRGSSARAELRCPDPSSNPYLVFAVMLGAGLDGLKRKLEPPAPVEENVYHFDEAKLRQLKIPTLPGSLGEAMSEMEGSKLVREVLGEHVFAKLLEAQKAQWDDYRLRVTPWEIDQYFKTV